MCKSRLKVGVGLIAITLFQVQQRALLSQKWQLIIW